MAISNIHTDTNIYIKDGEKVSRLFMLMGLKESSPSGMVDIEANKPLILTYDQRSNSEYCTISINVTFEKNHTYELVGGYGFGKSIIPFLPGHGNCQFGIKDIKSGKFIGTPLR